jgi:hypothetical protein
VDAYHWVNNPEPELGFSTEAAPINNMRDCYSNTWNEPDTTDDYEWSYDDNVLSFDGYGGYWFTAEDEGTTGVSASWDAITWPMDSGTEEECSFSMEPMVAEGEIQVPGCGDAEKNTILKEYGTFNVLASRTPGCNALRTDYASTHFSSAELNKSSGHKHDYFWVQTATLNALDAIRDDYGAAINTGAVYRCPLRNNQVNGEQQSWHLAGRGADLVPSPLPSPSTNIPEGFRTAIEGYARDHGATYVLQEDDHVHCQWAT